MPNTTSAKKRLRQSLIRRDRNRAAKSQLAVRFARHAKPFKLASWKKLKRSSIPLADARQDRRQRHHPQQQSLASEEPPVTPDRDRQEGLVLFCH